MPGTLTLKAKTISTGATKPHAIIANSYAGCLALRFGAKNYVRHNLECFLLSVREKRYHCKAFILFIIRLIAKRFNFLEFRQKVPVAEWP